MVQNIVYFSSLVYKCNGFLRSLSQITIADNILKKM